MADSGVPSGIPGHGSVVDLLTSNFSNKQQVQDLANSVDQVEQQAWSNTLNMAGWAYGLFGGVLDTLGSLVKSLGGLLKHVLLDVIYGHIKALFEAIKNWITNLRNWIK